MLEKTFIVLPRAHICATGKCSFEMIPLSCRANDRSPRVFTPQWYWLSLIRGFSNWFLTTEEATARIDNVALSA